MQCSIDPPDSLHSVHSRRNGRVYRNGQASEQRPKEDKDLLERECGLLAESGGLLVVGRRGGVIEAHARLASRSKRRVELRDGYVMGRRRDHPPPLIQDNVVGILNVGGVVEFADTGVVLTAPRMGDSLVDVAIDG